MNEHIKNENGRYFKKTSYRRRRRRTRQVDCHCCGKNAPFCWTCRCGFAICQECMMENFWGMSCNGITWFCPDCGESNGFGNQ
ncbi:MAG: hypothetical protein LJE66_16345 [Desulfobacterales bacterium]|nr:hypothetical protein [Desulfobacterales bacterium]